MKISSFYTFLSENSYILISGFILMTAILLTLTLMPGNYFGNSGIWSYDKLGHLCLFFGWTALLGLYTQLSRSKAVNLWYIFWSGVVFGALIEVLQDILPINRDPDIVDFIYDTIGCLLAMGFLKVVVRKSKSMLNL